MSRANLAAKVGDFGTREDHPAPDVLERFMRLELSREERSAVVRHLLTGCPQCRYITGRLWQYAERKPVSMEALLKKKAQSLRQQAPSQPTRREAAMAALVQAAQEMLLELAKELEAISGRLEGMASALPPSRQSDAEIDDVVAELRSVIRSVVAECLRSAIDDLRTAAYFPAEPPAAEDPAQ